MLLFLLSFLECSREPGYGLVDGDTKDVGAYGYFNCLHQFSCTEDRVIWDEWTRDEQC